MRILGENRFSRLTLCVEAAPRFQLSAAQARSIIDAQLLAVSTHWRDACDESRLGETERNALWGRQFLNPFALLDYREAS